MEHATFVQLTPEDCQYLLELIADIDSDTPYTTRQRSYTVPKLEKIAKSPESARLAWQDTQYLLELIEDDEEESFEQQREMTKATIEEIQELQTSRFREMKDIESQREIRRARRSPGKALQKHFEQTKA